MLTEIAVDKPIRDGEYVFSARLLRVCELIRESAKEAGAEKPPWSVSHACHAAGVSYSDFRSACRNSNMLRAALSDAQSYAQSYFDNLLRVRAHDDNKLLLELLKSKLLRDDDDSDRLALSDAAAKRFADADSAADKLRVLVDELAAGSLSIDQAERLSRVLRNLLDLDQKAKFEIETRDAIESLQKMLDSKASL